MAVDVFSVPVFFVVFRETLEAAIIVSVLLSFLSQTLNGPNGDVAVYKKLVRQVWLGSIIGFLICLIIGGGIIGAFYGLRRNAWSSTENYWEGSFGLFAAVIITVLGAALLRVAKLQEKWRVKIAKALEEKHTVKRSSFKRWCEKYALFFVPFITVLREGIEGVVFIAGVSFSSPAKSVPLPVFVGLAAGAAVGYAIYRGGSYVQLQYLLVVSTCVLYLVAAGLFSRSVWFFEAQKWSDAIGSDAAETGSGPGSYDISKSVWHLNYANPSINGGGGWGIFNAVLGWQNSATLGSVLSYNLYWLFVMAMFASMRFKEVRGNWPWMRPKKGAAGRSASVGSGSGDDKDKDEKVVSVQPLRTLEA